ncbi:BTAD domain-containing putative transcriptional regulator [Streptomyces sp. NPDC057617]|uniref:AfsR/SARP family transcriptional regulator n=1 Tax=Streptomyces sp. NPDC057617 TaxID=3346184 RepID=UPI0036A8398A
MFRRGSLLPPELPSGQGKEGLRFSVLGPVRVWRDGTLLPSGSPQQRAVLAALLLYPERTATAPQLIQAVWGDDPPAMALAAVRTYASRLRKILGRDVLISKHEGYTLRIEPDALDMGRAEGLVDEAAHAGRQRYPALVRELLDAAVALWDGEPLAGIPGPFAENQRNYLTNWRLELIEERLELDLEGGAHAEVVPELTALAAQHPLRERLRELLMLALYRSGRQAEALAVYADTRRLLADELGVEPGRRLSDLQQRILAADPGLSVLTAREAVDAEAQVVVPRQLPADVQDFTGRTAFVQELRDSLVSRAKASVIAISSVSGIAGVGKTALAARIAHDALEHFPDGQLYVDLQGSGNHAADPGAVLGGFLRALGTADSAVPDSLAEREALYRSLLEGRRVLILLDNARDTEQVRPLLPGPTGSATLVTSRRKIAYLPGVRHLNLDVMAPEEALELFASIVGEKRAAAERKATLDVVAACGFLPLAIRIIASRIAARPSWTIKSVAGALADERRRLDELQADDLAVRAVFEVGYQQLEPAQARAFRLLGLPDGPDISLAAASVVLDLPLDETKDLMESLVDASQLESTAPGRYRHHDLVRLYARECAERDEQPPSECESAMSRLLDFYLVTAKAVYATDRPDDPLIEHLEPTALPGLPFRNRREARDWQYDEARCLLAHVHRSTGRDTLRRAVDLLLASRDLAESGTYGQAYTAAAESVCEAARATSDTRAEVRARVCLSQAHVVAGRFEEADREAEAAMAAAIVSHDSLSAGLVPDQQGIIALYRNRHAEAQDHFRRAIAAFRANGDRSGEASALCNLARAQLALGDAPSAIRSAEQGLDMLRSMRAGLRVGNALYALGMALTVEGRQERATQVLSEAVDIFKEARHPFWEGMTRFQLAEAHLAADRPARAIAPAERALNLLSEVGGDWRRANVLTVLGKGLAGIGQTARARACWTEALSIYRELESPEAEEVTQLLATPIPRGLAQ